MENKKTTKRCSTCKLRYHCDEQHEHTCQTNNYIYYEPYPPDTRRSNWKIHYICPWCGEHTTKPLPECPLCHAPLSVPEIKPLISEKSRTCVIRPLNAAEIASLDNIKSGLGAEIAEQRQTVEYTDEDGHTGHIFVENKLIEELGSNYIATHCSLRYSEVLNCYDCNLSQEEFRNSPLTNPPKTVDVKFVEEKAGENTGVWQSVETGQYYLRFLFREPFARWMTCGNRNSGWQDQNTIRPNITFRHGNQEETVLYKDWNGSAAYSDTFNPNFRKGE